MAARFNAQLNNVASPHLYQQNLAISEMHAVLLSRSLSYVPPINESMSGCLLHDDQWQVLTQICGFVVFNCCCGCSAELETTVAAPGGNCGTNS